MPDIYKGSYCSGSPENWPVPEVTPGTALEEVLSTGVFQCGYPQNIRYTTSNGQLLLQTGSTGSGQVDGVLVAFWDELASYAGEEMGSEIRVEWTILENSQAILDELYAGNIHAACGFWSPNGKWRTPAENTVARGLAFSIQHCLTLLQEEFLYTLVEGSDITTFDELIAAATAGIVTNICVTGSPGGGTESTCQDTMEQYGVGAAVSCEGVADQAFARVESGECDAAWSGYPDVPEAWYAIAQPTFSAQVTLFRAKDEVTNDRNRRQLKASPVVPTVEFESTTLEQVVTKAFNVRVADGSWSMLGGLVDTRLVSFCTGSAENWPLPEVKPDSDLARVIDTGVFRCGYTQGVTFGSVNGEIFIQTGTATNEVSGLAVDFWNVLMEEMSILLSTPIAAEWTLYPTSQDVLTALYNGEVDSACAYWAADSGWQRPNGQEVARGLAFSTMTCPTVLQFSTIFTLAESGITSFDELVDAVDDGLATRICVSEAPGGGFEMSCQNLMDEYAPKGMVQCQGVGDQSFAQLTAGECIAVFEGIPPDDISNYNTFPQPDLLARVSFFRAFELVNRPLTPATTSAAVWTSTSTSVEVTKTAASEEKALEAPVSSAAGLAILGQRAQRLATMATAIIVGYIF